MIENNQINSKDVVNDGALLKVSTPNISSTGESDSQPKFTITQSSFSQKLLDLQDVLNSIFKLFTLKKSGQFWGVVYDSVSKQPLDPVIVKLLYVSGGEVSNCVTDMYGRYGFLAKPGKFKIFAKKTNYTFPSQFVLGDTDGIYENVYHGEFVLLSDDAEVFAPNIPMDPIRPDWNQEAKLASVQTYPFLRLLLQKMATVLLWFGLMFCLVELWVFKFDPPFYVSVFISVCVLLIILAGTIPHTRLWGKVDSNFILPPGARLFLELHRADLPGVGLGHTVVHEDGKFLILSRQGKYSLVVSLHYPDNKKVLLGTVNVKVGLSGVLNSTIKLRSS